MTRSTSGRDVATTMRRSSLTRAVILAAALAVLGLISDARADRCPNARCFGTCCASGQVCVNKGAGASCQCPSGSFLCEGVCVASSEENCGFCGNTCPENAVCVNGGCQCDAGFVFCGGACRSEE